MHDIHAANQILKTALEYAKKNKCKKIDSMTIELGKIVEHDELITPKNLKYNIELISKNTIAEDCEIIVNSKNNKELKLVEIDGE
ncbi:MAG: hydrogenase/urease maturation nickel metallochaperone HypA [Patescibacteria group bacterium]|nr:hydrogenase/urease maturation nickel metallochaperone HypA [Patescibacteria group bacterium]